MARPRKEAPVPSPALVASAMRFKPNAARIEPRRDSWQRECYRHYSICGEARYAARFVGHALSRATLHAAVMNESGEVSTVKEGPAASLLRNLFNGPNAQPQMLEAFGIHLTIAGEAYLIGRTAIGEESIAGDEIFEVVSPLEVEVSGGKWSLLHEDGKRIPLADDDVVIRVWMPKPGDRMQADSPFRSLLPILSEIEWLTRHIFAQVRSRLAGAGILFLPQGMSFPQPPDQGGEDQEFANEADAFMLTLAQAMETPLQDPESPASMVPIIATAPDDLIDKAKLMQFWSELDAHAMDLRAEAIRRFALGMDLPPEQVLGMSGTGGSMGEGSGSLNHWGSAQVEEQTVRMHVEPMLDTISNALTITYLRPLLSDGAQEFVHYDISALRVRPNRGRESVELWDRGLLKGEVVLRENGFETSDAMTDEERKEWLLLQIATSSATPDQMLAALRELGVTLDVPREDDDAGRESRPPPSLERHPDDGSRPRQRRGERRPAMAEDEVLIAACDALIWRAIEKAGNRILNDGKRGKEKIRGESVFEAHVLNPVQADPGGLLRDGFLCAQQVLEDLTDVDTAVTVMRNYCLTLFATRQPHTRERFVEYLETLDD